MIHFISKKQCTLSFFRNTFFNLYRYGGGTSILGNQRSSSLFGGGGRRAFGIGAGAGFLGNMQFYEILTNFVAINMSEI